MIHQTMWWAAAGSKMRRHKPEKHLKDVGAFARVPELLPSRDLLPIPDLVASLHQR